MHGHRCHRQAQTSMKFAPGARAFLRRKKTDSALPGKPRAHSARRTAGLGVTIVEGVLVDETENVRPFIVRAHHELTARRESAPERLILIAGRVCAFQTPDKGVALLLRYDKRGKSTAPPFGLGNPIPLSSPCPDQRRLISAQRLLRDQSGEDQ